MVKEINSCLVEQSQEKWKVLENYFFECTAYHSVANMLKIRIYKTVIFTLYFKGEKRDLLLWGKNIYHKCCRTKCWGKSLDLWGIM